MPAGLDVRHVVERRAGDWEARCVANRGCPAPRTLSPCPQPGPRARLPAPRTPAEVLAQRERLLGQRLTVQGTLRVSLTCGELACPRDVCCNTCFSNLALGTTESTGPTIVLGAERDPVLGCHGDDSGLCCGTEMPSREVLATGTLRVTADGTLRLEGVRLCAQ